MEYSKLFEVPILQEKFSSMISSAESFRHSYNQGVDCLLVRATRDTAGNDILRIRKEA
jgi:hypothetical protein